MSRPSRRKRSCSNSGQAVELFSQCCKEQGINTQSCIRILEALIHYVKGAFQTYICSSDWQMLLEERLVKGQQSCVYESTSITHCIKWLHGDQWVPIGNLVTLTVQWICINLYIYVACTLQGFENDNWTNGAEPPKSEYNFVYRLPGLLQLWLESRETNENLFPEPAVSWNNFCFILNA